MCVCVVERLEKGVDRLYAKLLDPCLQFSPSCDFH